MDAKTDLGQKGYLFLLTLAATLGGLLFGYDTAVISGTVKHLEAFFIEPLAADPAFAENILIQFRITVIVSFVVILYAVGAILVKLFGRKKGLSIASVLAVIVIFVLVIRFNRPVDTLGSTLSSIKGFTISSALIGCIIGGSLGGFISRNLGRRNGLRLAALLFLISALGSAMPEKLNIFGVEPLVSFIIYRIIGGVGVGLASMLSPMYIAEIAPAHSRGKLVSWNQFAIIFGMVVIYFINLSIARGQTDEWLNTVGWRYMFASESIPAILFLILLIFVPETPRYLVLKEKNDEALTILQKINGSKIANELITEIKLTFSNKTVPWLSFGGLVIIVGILLSMFQQFVGINVVLYYAPEIFRTLGSGTESALIQTVIVGIINLSFTVIAILSVDKFGRKKLQIIGAAGMAISMTGLGFIFFYDKLGYGALLFMLIYVASFALSWGPVTWVLLSEIFPNSIRDAMSIAVAAQWISNFVVSWTFPLLNENALLTDKFNHGFAYWIYALMSILAIVFIYKLVPETKKKRLEEIELYWKKKG